MKKLFIVLFIFLITGADLYSREKQYSDSTLAKNIATLELNNVNIVDALRMLARKNKINIVIGPQVQGRVTASFKNVSLGDVLNTILKTSGFHFYSKYGTIIIKSYQNTRKSERVNKIFRLKYVDAIELQSIIKPVLSSQGETQVLELVKTGQIEKRRSDILLVCDVPENLSRIETVINQLDIAQPQILIEARLVETILGKNNKFGIDWPKQINGKISGADVDGDGVYNTDNSAGDGISSFSEIPASIKSFKLGILSFSELSFALNMLASDENSNLISNPKIVTLNNKEAMIRIGTNIPIPEVSRGVGGDLVTYKDKSVNVKLIVIPQVQPGKNINLSVHPVIEEIIGYTGSSDYPQPITSVREVKTNVTVAPGETIVIGGMVKDNKTVVEDKLWLLGDIPLLGKLFTTTREEIKKSDLLIFITPKIVGGDFAGKEVAK